jgi:hypothetical protein
MPVWVSVHGRKPKIGEVLRRLPDGTPQFVAELKEMIPPMVLIGNYNAIHWNAQYPNEKPIALQPEIPRTYARVVGPQLTLFR